MPESTPSKGTCRSGCPTQSCGSYSECLRAANVKVAYSNSAKGFDRSAQKRWDRELADYSAARAQGIQPESTKRAAIDRAVAISDKTGRAFDAS